MVVTAAKKIWLVVVLLFIAAAVLVWDGLYRRSTAPPARGSDLTVFVNGGEPVAAGRDARRPSAPRRSSAPPPRRTAPPRRTTRADPPPPEPDRFWTVEKGQTLSGISRQCYGSAARWRDIADANGIDDPRGIRPGQRLRIPR
jgi:nucleoid-associated protein YgaU